MHFKSIIYGKMINKLPIKLINTLIAFVCKQSEFNMHNNSPKKKKKTHVVNAHKENH